MSKHTFPCGCKVRFYNDIFNSWKDGSIKYCPKHKAAPEMYETLHHIKNANRSVNEEHFSELIEKACVAALALADGDV